MSEIRHGEVGMWLAIGLAEALIKRDPDLGREALAALDGMANSPDAKRTGNSLGVAQHLIRGALPGGSIRTADASPSST